MKETKHVRKQGIEQSQQINHYSKLCCRLEKFKLQLSNDLQMLKTRKPSKAMIWGLSQNADKKLGTM